MLDNHSHKSRRNTPLKSSRVSLAQNISPVKSSHYKTLNQDKKHIINKLLYLFTFYSSKISKYSYKQLNQKYFVQLISDLYQIKHQRCLVKNSLEYKDFMNIYFSKGVKNLGTGIKFEEFLQTLPVISIYLFPEIQQRQVAVKQLIQSLMILYDIRVGPFIQAQLVEYQQPINDETKQMIIKLQQAFGTVYKIYFGNQLAGKFNTKQPTQQSFDTLLNMMKDFQIFPKLVSASSLYFIYNETLKSTENNLLCETEFVKQKIVEKGTLFTLSKLIQFLVSCSRICFAKLKNLQNPQYDINYQKQILKTLLQYMETIKSTKSSLKGSIVFKQNRFSFILLQQYENDEKDRMSRTFILKDKIVKQSQNQMQFFSLFQKIHL